VQSFKDRLAELRQRAENVKRGGYDYGSSSAHSSPARGVSSPRSAYSSPAGRGSDVGSLRSRLDNIKRGSGTMGASPRVEMKKENTDRNAGVQKSRKMSGLDAIKARMASMRK
jgi:hypothetical protein